MIFVNDKYCIDRDQYNWILCRNKPQEKLYPNGEKGKTYPQICFFNSLQTCLMEIRRRMIREKLQDHDCTLAEALAVIRATDSETLLAIRAAVTPCETTSTDVRRI